MFFPRTRETSKRRSIHPCAAQAKPLRDQLAAFVDHFNKADLRKCALAGGDQRPAAMFWGAVEYAAGFLKD